MGHAPAFWEALGRAVATFGFLEETLGKAIFAYTGMRPIPEEQIDAAYDEWTLTLEHALSDALGSLIDTYGKVVRDHGGATAEKLDVLIDRLRKAATLRNVLCHGSWNKKPDAEGRSIPFFVTGLGGKQRIFDYPHRYRLPAAVAACRGRVGMRSHQHGHTYGLAVSGV